MPGHSRASIADAKRRLAAAGCISAAEEVKELAAASLDDDNLLEQWVTRRTTGEPLAWITGGAIFCGCRVAVTPGVFVPRWQSETLAERAAELLPPRGRAIDLGTGSGAIACVLAHRRPGASVLGTDRDPIAVRCARQNGVDAVEGDLFESVPPSWKGTVDVVVGVLPYVPTSEIAFLPRDVPAFEPIAALDGGEDGLGVIRRVLDEVSVWLRRGGHLLLEIGGEEPDTLIPMLETAEFGAISVLTDEDGDPRGVEAVSSGGQARRRSSGAR